MPVIVASLDLGIKNTALTIESFDPKLIKPPPAVNQRYNSNGEPTPVFKDYLQKFIYPGDLIHYSKASFTNEKVIQSVEPSKEILWKVNEWVKSMIPILSQCSVILIEQQMKTNINAKRLEHHLHSMFIFWMPNIDVVIFPSTYKTRLIGAPKIWTDGKKLGKRRKEWAVQVATQILLNRKDDWYLFSLIINSKKPDDQCDTLLMIQAYKIKWYIKGPDTSGSLPVGYHKEKERPSFTEGSKLKEYLSSVIPRGVQFDLGSVELLSLYRYLFPKYYIPERKKCIPYNTPFSKLEQVLKNEYKIIDPPMDLDICCEKRKDDALLLTLNPQPGMPCYFSCPHGTIVSGVNPNVTVKCGCKPATITFI